MGKRSHLRNVISSTRSSISAASASSSTTSSAFDVVTSTVHHAVLNRHIPGRVKQQSQANQKAIDKRQQALITVLKQRDKQNTFIDARVGEERANQSSDHQHNSHISNDTTTSKRFQLERLRQLSKSSRFNLDDNQAQDKKRRIQTSDDPQHLHSHHPRDDSVPSGIRGMPDVVLKSKLYRAEKAEQSSLQKDLVDSLDKEFTEIRTLVEYKGKDADEANEQSSSTATDDFTVQTRLLMNEARARAQERSLTPEEKANQEKDRLIHLEKQRQKRMKPPEREIDEEPETQEEEEEEEEENVGVGSKRKQRRDAEKRERRAAKSSSITSAITDVIDDSQPLPSFPSSSRSSVDVPFTFPCPSSYVDFVAILTPYSSSVHPLIYQRIVACHHWASDTGNKHKLETFLTCLFTHFHTLCEAHPHKGLSSARTNELMQQLDAITALIFELAEQMPEHAGQIARNMVIKMYSVQKAGSFSLSAADLLVVKLLFDLFPCTDFRHNVITPLFILLAQSLNEVEIKQPRDLLGTLFVSLIIIQSIGKTQRFMPEIIHAMEKCCAFIETQAEKVLNLSDNSVVDFSLLFLQASATPFEVSLPPLFSLLLVCIDLTAKCYQALPNYTEIFLPFYRKLRHIQQQQNVTNSNSNISDSRNNPLSSLLDFLHCSISAHNASRLPLSLPASPPSVRLHNPVFVADYQPGKDYDPVKERAEYHSISKKMKDKQKSEWKEMRKERLVYRTQENKIVAEKKKEREEERKRHWAEMEEQARDSNILHEQSKKKRRKAK